MESQTLRTRAPRQLSAMSHHRAFSCHFEVMRFVVVLFVALLCLAACGPCSMNDVQTPPEYDACGSYRDNLDLGFQDAFGGDASLGIMSGKLIPQLNLDNICGISNLFCFPSTLPGYFAEEHSADTTVLEASEVPSDGTLAVGSRNNVSWSSNCDCGVYKLLRGRVVSCSLNFQEGISDISCCQKSSSKQNDVSSCRGGGPLVDKKAPNINPNENSDKIKTGSLDGSSVLHVEISPPLLDWGQKYLYSPSFAFLTVANTHNDSILNVYEPYGTNSQFYPCNHSELMLGPGEVASICFVFLPTFLGMSSSHLIMQTSSGGFLIQARGFAVESPYGIQPLVGLDVSSSGRWSKNLSLFNPFDDTIYVEEVNAWISFSSENTSHSTKAICSVNNLEASADSMPSVKEWLDVKSSGQVGLSAMAMRPHGSFEVGPQGTETLMEIDFPYHYEGKIVGAFCMQLQRSSKDKVDTVMVPIEAEMGGKSVSDDINNFVLVSLEALVPCGDSGTIVALSLKNPAPYLLTVVKISGSGEGTESFHIKYMEGLILFPGTVTQVAVVTYTPVEAHIHDSPPEISTVNRQCKLVVLTNDSSSPQIEIPCEDIVNVCSSERTESYIGHKHHSEKEHGNARTMMSPSQIKGLGKTEADELVLGNWRSQATTSGMSVLDDREVLFPMVEVGTHRSKWIAVKNPSRQPVVMQLVLNSGEIIDECRDQDGLLEPSSSSSLVRFEHATPTKYGFSMAEPAVTEAYVHPKGRALLGPIIFHPSSRCTWKSSALIRNNLSGVEWLPLQGFGGSLSLALFEGSEPLQAIEFFSNLPSFLNFSPPDMFYVENSSRACSQPLSKVFYAKNVGDLPLEVSRIEVSGTECRLDGFIVHNCKGFALEPGESTKLKISYQTDFSAAMVQRDLELALPTGFLVIPMKASLPISILTICKKSVLWTKVKKSSVAILLVGSIMYLVFYYILPQAMIGSQDYLLARGKSTISILRHGGKSSTHLSPKNSSKFTLFAKMNGFLRSMEEEETLIPEQVNPTRVVNSNNSLWSSEKKPVSSSLLPKSLAVESRDIQEPSPSPPANLTVKIGKEKGRRRRKKKGSGTGGLTAQLEVSSSQSGNSTPSSPLSPTTSLTPKRFLPMSPNVDQCVVNSRNPFTNMANARTEKNSASKAIALEPKVSMKYVEKPFEPKKSLLFPSATFPCTVRRAPNVMCSSPFLASTSTIAPHARAPGSKLYEGGAVKTEGSGQKDEFRYDIWGEHIFGLRHAGRSNEVFAKSPLAIQCNSDSFFVRGPQSLVTISKLKSVSSHQEDG